MNYFWDFLIGNGSGNRKWLTVVLRSAVCFTISLVREQDSESNYLSRSETLPTWSQAGRARPICNACPQRPRRLESRAGTGSSILSFYSPCYYGDWRSTSEGSWRHNCLLCLLQ